MIMFCHDYDLLTGMQESTVALSCADPNSGKDDVGASQLQAIQTLPAIQPTSRPSSGRVPGSEARLRRTFSHIS
jgi:hypothetical protein